LAVDLRLESGGLRLAVTDDGRGGVGGERAAGYGIVGMRERAALASAASRSRRCHEAEPG